MIKHDWQTTALAAFLLTVTTLACIGLFAVLGGAAEYVLMALPIVIGVWLVLREMARKRIE